MIKVTITREQLFNAGVSVSRYPESITIELPEEQVDFQEINLPSEGNMAVFGRIAIPMNTPIQFVKNENGRVGYEKVEVGGKKKPKRYRIEKIFPYGDVSVDYRIRGGSIITLEEIE